MRVRAAAVYHDQGHGPGKVTGQEEGVNTTVGLPVVRTSVDHGIAGTGRADERSTLEAMRQAGALAPRRAAWSRQGLSGACAPHPLTMPLAPERRRATHPRLRCCPSREWAAAGRP
jgi:hypothetical protein